MRSLVLVLIIPVIAWSQQQVSDTSSVSKRLDLSVEVVSFYVWRGQTWGGKYTAVQPSADFHISKNLTLGIWATSNFERNYYEEDNVTPKGYQEFDIGLTYHLADFCSVSLWDYYWPAVGEFQSDKSYFHFGPESCTTLDATIDFDFTEAFRYPLKGKVSTLIGGNDYNMSADGRYKRNFTTYIEIGYVLKDCFKAELLKDVEIVPVIGAVLNNAAGYYAYADYDKVSFINLQMMIKREFQIGYGLTMPLTVTYTRNAAGQNLEPFGPDSLVAGLSIEY